VTDLLAILTRRPPWMRDAACREHPTLTWFAERGQSITEQRRICASCLVHAECTAYGADEDHGLWGGLSGRERRRQRRSAA
jgi:WhiB family redox-sensing transcriptional regulator